MHRAGQMPTEMTVPGTRRIMEDVVNLQDVVRPPMPMEIITQRLTLVVPVEVGALLMPCIRHWMVEMVVGATCSTSSRIVTSG
mmetsp:Transcript_11422/g.17190  ORF Transcript_11422/g.17190 Transcript_11422/m.17190 type:complete len:83 (-) Transcript_11422:1483-1731(-)